MSTSTVRRRRPVNFQRGLDRDGNPIVVKFIDKQLDAIIEVTHLEKLPQPVGRLVWKTALYRVIDRKTGYCYPVPIQWLHDRYGWVVSGQVYPMMQDAVTAVVSQRIPAA